MNCCDEFGNCKNDDACPVRRVNSTPLQQKAGGKRIDTDLPITKDDGGFFDTLDDLVIAARWFLLAFAVLVLSAFSAGYFFN